MTTSGWWPRGWSSTDRPSPGPTAPAKPCATTLTVTLWDCNATAPKGRRGACGTPPARRRRPPDAADPGEPVAAESGAKADLEPLWGRELRWRVNATHPAVAI